MLKTPPNKVAVFYRNPNTKTNSISVCIKPQYTDATDTQKTHRISQNAIKIC